MLGVDAATVSLLLAAAFAAGCVDSVVGGGGLIQLPALLILLPGAGPVNVLATNKLASIMGTSVAATTYARRLRPDPRTVVPLAGLAFCGAVLGALVGAHIPKAAFTPMILAVLIVVGAYTLAKPDLGRVSAVRFEGRRSQVVAAVIGLGIGCWDGMIGPGTGSFLVFALVGVMGYGFLGASAHAKIANAATNLGALVVFVPLGAVLWPVGLLMGAANIAGGYLGARIAMARGDGFVKAVFVVVVAGFILKLGADLLSPYL